MSSNFIAFNPPPQPRQSLPILQYLVSSYKLWHEILPHIAKDKRYALGGKIDEVLVETIESILTASFLLKDKKLPYIQRATAKLDLAKFFLQVLWEMKGLDTKKYSAISEKLNEVGRMLGGWLRQLANQSSPARHL